MRQSQQKSSAFLSAEMFKKPLWLTVWTQIRLLLGAVCSRSTLFASILNLSVMLGNYLQQTISADNIFRCIFFLGALRVKMKWLNKMCISLCGMNILFLQLYLE